MIIYNSSYEFIGISDSYVKRLDFPSFNALKYRANGDIANLFVEKKGFVYNFQYLSWIEFILQNIDKAQVIIKSGDGSHYKIEFSIEPYYFIENNEKGYLIKIKTMEDYEMDGFEIDDTSFQINQDENVSYYVDEDEYHVSDEESFITTEESTFEDDSPTFSFGDSENNKQKPPAQKKESDKFSFDESSEEEFNSVEINMETKQSEKQTQAIQSPEEFLKSFEIEDKVNIDRKAEETLNIESLLSSGATSNSQPKNESFPLEQDEIDLIFQNGADSEIELTSQNKFHKTFNSDNYIIDEVAKELHIKKDVLIDFLIDFIHHINHLKPYIYDNLENHRIKDIKNAVFMLKGLSFNLRIMDIYNILDKIYSSYYRESSELFKDVDSIYKKIIILNKEINSGGATLKFDVKEVRLFVSSLNHSSLPDILFQDIVNSFLRLFDNSKEKLEASLNPDGIESLKLIIQELDNISKPLNIDELNLPIISILENINSKKIEYDKLVMNWIELSDFINKLR